MTINNSDIEMCTIHHYLSRFIIIHHDSSWFIFGLVYPEAYTARRKELFHYGSEDLGDGLWCECQNRIVIHISSWWLVCHWIGVLGEFNRKPFYVIGKKNILPIFMDMLFPPRDHGKIILIGPFGAEFWWASHALGEEQAWIISYYNYYTTFWIQSDTLTIMWWIKTYYYQF